MIAYIKGEITSKHPTYVVVETGGLGYHINISLYTYAGIEKLERVKLLTHLHIKEDSHTLYGFSEAVERSLFVHLISVSGVGPNTAQLILSGMNPDELRAAIIGEDVLSLKRVKGVGPKTAQRIILDLKDKLFKDAGDEPINIPAANNTIRQEALSALVSLGFNKGQVQKVLNSILKEEKKLENVEQLIKLALKKMG
jgi:Holliday junction DNA helicase RuvA